MHVVRPHRKRPLRRREAPMRALMIGGTIVAVGGLPYKKPLISEMMRMTTHDKTVTRATTLLEMFFIPL